MTQVQPLSEDEIDSLPLKKGDVSDPTLYQNDNWHAYFQRRRRERPVHYCTDSPYGPYWSITRDDDIMIGGAGSRALFLGHEAWRH